MLMVTIGFVVALQFDPKHGGIIVLDGPNDSSPSNLERCYGECDNDDHCRFGLECFQRDNGEEIPGCSGSGSGGDWDYCVSVACKRSKRWLSA